MDSKIFPKKKFGDIKLSNIPPTSTTSSSITTSTSSILSTSRRSTGLHHHNYSRLWLSQIRRAVSGTESESIRLFRTSLGFRVQPNIVHLVAKQNISNCNKTQKLKFWHKLWQNSKTRIVTKIKKKKWLQNSTTLIVTKL